MKYASSSVEMLVEEFSKLPGIGKKTAQRLTMFILKQKKEDAVKLSNAITTCKEKVIYCDSCQNLMDVGNSCFYCASTKRNQSMICVVESPVDVLMIEHTGNYNGVYHVLHGVISPLDGIGPNHLKVKELITRLSQSTENLENKEIILALNPTVEGETTILYLTKLLKPLGVKISRIARGIPVGVELEFTDSATLVRAIEGRMIL